MSFGKRTRDNSGWHEPITSNPNIAAVINGGPRKAKNPHADTLLTFAMVLGVLSVVIFGMYSLDSLFNGALLGNNTHALRQIADTGLHATVAEMCAEPAQQPAEGDEAALKSLPGPLRSPDFLKCMMTKYPERFCEPESRRQMARDLSTYVLYHQRKLNEREALMRDPNARQIAELYEKLDNASAKKPSSIDQDVIKSMQALVRNGYLSEQDFGWNMLDHMKPHIDGIRREKFSCP